MKILFIGGNGNISWWCVQKALECGHEVWELNRALTRKTRRKVQDDVHEIICDIYERDIVKNKIEGMCFDVVCDFICYNEEHASNAISLFGEKTHQYIFISSDSVYKRISRNLPFNENSEQYDMKCNSNYICGKIKAEKVFMEAFYKDKFPVTIVRPGFTYDTIISTPIGRNCFSVSKMLLEGYPLLMLGDGMNLWSPLHSEDFANAFVSLLGNEKTIGEVYNISGTQLITWNEVAESLLVALNLPKQRIIHIPFRDVCNLTIFKDKILSSQSMWHYVYDLSKIRMEVPMWRQQISYSDGIQRTIDWIMEDDARKRIDINFCNELKQIYSMYCSK